MTTGLAVRIFGLLYGALALTIAFELSSSRPETPKPVAARAHPSVHVGSAVPQANAADRADPTGELVETVLARPLFSASRKPRAEVAESSEMPRLSGIVMSPAGQVAIFQPASASDKRSIVIAKGGEIDGWTVTDIANDGVTLARASETVTLRPKFQSGQPPAATAATAPPKEASASRWTQAAASGILRSRWSNPHLQP